VVAWVVIDWLVGQRAISMSWLEVSFGFGALLLPACPGVLFTLGLWRVACLLIAGLALTRTILSQTIDVPEHPLTVSQRRDVPMTEPPKFLSRAASEMSPRWGEAYHCHGNCHPVPPPRV
jgi:FHS family glucose/mannose:H+ symporter-like MFS transporter